MQLSTHSLMGLRDIRALLNIPASTIAHRIGCTVTTYYRFERGERRIYWDKALAIASFLEVPAEMLARELTTEERVSLFKRGQGRLTDHNAEWDDLIADVAQQSRSQPSPTPAAAPTPRAEPTPSITSTEQLLAEWDSEDDE